MYDESLTKQILCLKIFKIKNFFISRIAKLYLSTVLSTLYNADFDN